MLRGLLERVRRGLGGPPSEAVGPASKPGRPISETLPTYRWGEPMVSGPMRAVDAERRLRAIMRAQGLTLKRLMIGPAVDLMTDFYDRYVCADAEGRDGDGLAFGSVFAHGERGTFLEVSLARLFRAGSCERYPGCRLRLTLHYDQATFYRITPGLGIHADYFCWDRSKLARFRREIQEGYLFRELADVRPLSAKIAAEPAWGTVAAR